MMYNTALILMETFYQSSENKKKNETINLERSMATRKRIPALLLLAVVCMTTLYQWKIIEVVASAAQQVEGEGHSSDLSFDDDVDVTIVKIGGSSITDKASFETLRPDVLNWFARSIASSIGSDFLDPDVKLSSNSSSMSCDVDNNGSHSSSSTPF